MRTLGTRSVHAIFLRRGILSARVSAGALGDDALPPPRGRASPGNAAADGDRAVGAPAKKTGLRLRRSYVRVARRAAMKMRRYLHAQQKKRARRQLKFMGVRLRRLFRYVRRKTVAASALSERQAKRLEIASGKAWRIPQQQRGDPGYLYSWHAMEVECISKGKARALRMLSPPVLLDCRKTLPTCTSRRRTIPFSVPETHFLTADAIASTR